MVESAFDIGANRGARRAALAPGVVKVTEATLTYVAIDGSGVKRQLPAM